MSDMRKTTPKNPLKRQKLHVYVSTGFNANLFNTETV